MNTQNELYIHFFVFVFGSFWSVLVHFSGSHRRGGGVGRTAQEPWDADPLEFGGGSGQGPAPPVGAQSGRGPHGGLGADQHPCRDGGCESQVPWVWPIFFFCWIKTTWNNDNLNYPGLPVILGSCWNSTKLPGLFEGPEQISNTTKCQTIISKPVFFAVFWYIKTVIFQAVGPRDDAALRPSGPRRAPRPGRGAGRALRAAGEGTSQGGAQLVPKKRNGGFGLEDGLGGTWAFSCFFVHMLSHVLV